MNIMELHINHTLPRIAQDEMHYSFS